MSRITLADVRLSEYDLESLPRLAALRARLMNAHPEVCVERARYVTRFLRDVADPDEPAQLSYARAVGYFLARKAPVIERDDLLAGSTTSKRVGAPVYPELTGLTIWPELDTIGTRERNPIALSRREAEELDRQIFPYWMRRSVLEVTRAETQDHTALDLFERIVFFIAGQAGAVSHTVPRYEEALRRGVLALIEDAAEHEASQLAEGADPRRLAFYRGVQCALQGVLDYAANLAAEARRLAAAERDARRRAELAELARICTQVPARPARTFHEAVNALWILQVAIHAENINMAISPGRLDQVLYPWYRTDVDAGRLTVAQALELVGCLWLKLNDNTGLVPETAEELFGGAGTVPAVTLGGVDARGRDAVNDLTYVMLRATELLRTRDPSVNARFHYGQNERRFRDRVCEVIAHTKAVPALYNDVAAIEALRHQGVAAAHARDWAVIGCVELGVSGRSYDSSSSIILNLVSALELALYDGRRPVTGDERIGLATGDPAGFASFEQFEAAYYEQLGWLIGKAVELNDALGRTHQERLPSPLLSALFHGPMQAGRDLIDGGALYNSSGATHIGFAEVVDSLSAVQAAVFDEHRCTFAELLDALRADFAGYDELHAWLVHRAPKFGADDTAAQKHADTLVRYLYETYHAHVDYRGGRYRPAYWTMTNHAGQGRLTGALPDGRRAGRPFASGITPVSQATRDLAGCLQAVAALPAECIPGGEALNLKFPNVEVPQDLDRLGGAVEGYFRAGGMHVQFNMMSYEMLVDARLHPDRYPDLLVRVSGYSAYFNDLNDAMKDEIITRTAYELRDGAAVPFPGKYRSLLPTDPVPSTH